MSLCALRAAGMDLCHERVQRLALGAALPFHVTEALPFHVTEVGEVAPLASPSGERILAVSAIAFLAGLALWGAR